MCHWLWKDHTQPNPEGCRNFFRNAISCSLKRKKEKIKFHARGFLVAPLTSKQGNFDLGRFFLFKISP